MRMKNASRNYGFSDGELKQMADLVLLLINRDLDEFSTRGFNHNKQQEFEGLINQFADILPDETYLAMQFSKTEEKNAARQKLEQMMRTFFLMAKGAFGENTGRYKEFGDTLISRTTDETLVRNAKMMRAALIKYQPALSDEGFNSQHLSDFEAAYQLFDDAIDAQKQAIQARDVATEERINLGNELYALVSKYTEIGKDLWRDLHAAKYNDYLIYDRVASSSNTTDDSSGVAEDNPFAPDDI